MSTFVHNEPTCLNVIQEAGLPETFYKIVEFGLEPVIEVGVPDGRCVRFVVNKTTGTGYSMRPKCCRCTLPEPSWPRPTGSANKNYSQSFLYIHVGASPKGSSGEGERCSHRDWDRRIDSAPPLTEGSRFRCH